MDADGVGGTREERVARYGKGLVRRRAQGVMETQSGVVGLMYGSATRNGGGFFFLCFGTFRWRVGLLGACFLFCFTLAVKGTRDQVGLRGDWTKVLQGPAMSVAVGSERMAAAYAKHEQESIEAMKCEQKRVVNRRPTVFLLCLRSDQRSRVLYV